MATASHSTTSSASETSPAPIALESLFSRNPRQIEAWNAQCEKRFLLYGGQAGGGKSFFLRWWAVGYLIDLFEAGIPKAQVGIFCEDYPSLVDRQISKIQMEFPESLGKLKQGNFGREFVLNNEFGAGKILLRNLDDPSKYLSAEFAGIGVDELTRNPLSMFDFLRMRLRWPGVSRPRFIGTTNPGGIGHKWVKDYWIKQPREFPRELMPLADEFVFVSAKASDNPYLTDTYREELKTLPPAMAKAYAEGSWDVFAGQYFDVFNTEKHVQWTPDLDAWTARWISIDWGFNHPSAVYWHATIEEGNHVTYREFVQNNLTPKMLAAAILERTGSEKIQNVYLSPDAFARRTNYETVASQLDDEFRRVGLPSVEPADNDRVGGWMLMYGLLREGQWHIDPRCPKLIEGMQAATRDDPPHQEDILKAEGDDPIDSARYGIKSRLSLAPIPRSVQIERRVTSPDISIAMIQRRKAEIDIKESQPHSVRRTHPSMRRWAHV